MEAPPQASATDSQRTSCRRRANGSRDKRDEAADTFLPCAWLLQLSTAMKSELDAVCSPLQRVAERKTILTANRMESPLVLRQTVRNRTLSGSRCKRRGPKNAEVQPFQRPSHETQCPDITVHVRSSDSPKVSHVSEPWING